MKHKKLSHLTIEQVKTLINRYNNTNEKVADLLKEYEIEANPSELVSLFPQQVHTDLLCTFCDETSMISKPEPRSKLYQNRTPYCPKCSHKACSTCFCENCRKLNISISLKEEKSQKRVIEKEFTYSIAPHSIDQITLKDAVYLIALMNHSLTEDLKFVEPFNSNESKYAPHFQLQDKATKYLYGRGFIKISAESPIDAFLFNEDITCTVSYSPTEVLWDFLPSLDLRDKKIFLKNIQEKARNDQWPESWHADTDKFWRQIAKYECIEYYDCLLRERNYNLTSIGDKTHTTFETLIEIFPISKIYNIIWGAIVTTNDFNHTMKMPHHRGKNNFIGAVMKRAERALAQEWELKHYRRGYNCQQSAISSTFFNLFLGVGDRYFETIPPKLS